MNDHPHHHGPRDHDEERLRRLLDDAVSDVEPREGLESIHARVKVTPMNRKRPWLLAAGAAVVATAATVAAVTVLADDTSPTAADPGFAASSPAQSAEPDPEPDDSLSAESGTDGSAASPAESPAPMRSTETVPVYYTGDTSRGPRLYREFHRVEVRGDDTLTAALTEAVASSPRDSDYRTDWPSGTSATGAYDGDTITVDLSGSPLRKRPSGMTPDEASIAVEQLVYTAQAVVQDRAPVRFRVDGRPTDTLLGVPVAEPVSQGGASDVLAQVWIIEPQEGAAVTGPVEVSGLAAAFEANVQWRLVRNGKVVERGFTTAEECCTMAPYSFTIKGVEPGTYTLVVHDTDPSGGEGFAPWRDSKTIEVR